MNIKNIQGTDFSKGYGMIGKMFFFMHPELDARSKVVYCFLSTFGDVAYPSRKTIAKACSMNLKTIDKCLKALIQSGVLIKCNCQRNEKGEYTSVSYSICHKLSDIEKNKKTALDRAPSSGAPSNGIPSRGAPFHGVPSDGTVIVDLKEKRQEKEKGNSPRDMLRNIIDSIGGI